MLDIDEQELRQAVREVGCFVRSGDRNAVESVLLRHARLSHPEPILELILAEFTAREEAGEKPDTSVYVARFPNLRDRIERLLKIHKAFAIDAAAEIEAIETTTPHDTGFDGPRHEGDPRQAVRTVGDYEILEPIGQGGMGVVHKARHRTLGRLVAYKEIRSDFIGPHQRARLLREASATARLQHPHIVQIYEVGEAPSGPFFCMEWIDGGSLDRFLSTEPYDDRAAALLVSSLASAMDYAHCQGVIHRDLKPSNVLLTKSGQVKVTDFGLAKIIQSALDSDLPSADASITQTGAVLGTPAYMAPEQVDGTRAEVGVGTDIYAIGAILYELLTGRPPFRGDSSLETFQLICGSEPVPPRRIRPKISRDLETICLKCLQKDPRRRYASAADLHADLQRFVDGRPIVARPVGLAGRIWRSCRRKPLAAGLAAALLISVSAGMAAVAWQWIRAEALMSVAQTNARQAELGRFEAEQQRNRAIEQRSRALAEQARAERNFQAATNVVERFTRLGEELSRTAGAEETGRVVLEQSLSFFQGLLQLDSADLETTYQTAMAHYRAARIQHELGRLQDAEQTIGRAIALLEKVSQPSEAPTEYRSLLAHLHFQRVLIHHQAADPSAAATALEQTIRLAETLVREFPEDASLRTLLATARIHGLVVGETASVAERNELLRRAATMLENASADRSENGWAAQDAALAKECLAMIAWQEGQLSLAESLLREAIDLRRRATLAIATPTASAANRTSPPQRSVMDADAAEARQRLDVARTRAMRSVVHTADFRPAMAGSSDHRYYQARNHVILGLIVRQSGELAEAAESFRQAVATASDLCTSAPNNRRYQLLLATGQTHLATTLARQAQSDQAIMAFLPAARTLRQLARTWSEDDPLHAELPFALSLPFAPVDHPAGAFPSYAPTADDLREIVESIPIEPRLLHDLALACRHVSDWLRAIDNRPGWEIALRLATDVHERAAAAFPLDSEYQLALASAHFRLASQLDKWNRQAEALESVRKSIEVRTRLIRARLDVDDELIDRLRSERLWMTYLLRTQGRTAEAAAVLRAELEQAPDNPSANNSMAWFLATCKDGQFRDPAAALPLAEHAVALAPDRATYWNTLAAVYYRLGRYDDAVQAVRKAIERNGRRPSVSDLCLLSMSEYHRSNLSAARQHFDAAVAWREWSAEHATVTPRDAADGAELINEAREQLGDLLLTNHDAPLGVDEESDTLFLDDAQLYAIARPSADRIMRQQMRPFGPCWSGDSQLWWLAGGVGSQLILDVDVEREGVYEIVAQFTQAHNYGQVQLHVGDRPVGESFDGFNPGQHPVDVVHSGPIVLGRAQLAAGRNPIVLKVVGKAPSSTDYMVGIDNLEFRLDASQSSTTD